MMAKKKSYQGCDSVMFICPEKPDELALVHQAYNRRDNNCGERRLGEMMEGRSKEDESYDYDTS